MEANRSFTEASFGSTPGSCKHQDILDSIDKNFLFGPYKTFLQRQTKTST